MQIYEYRTDGSGKPKDKSNHSIDALRYVLTEIEGKGAITTISASTYQADPLDKLETPAEAAIRIARLQGYFVGEDGLIDTTRVLFGTGPDGKPQYVRVS
jgi:hypothetical protein